MSYQGRVVVVLPEPNVRISCSTPCFLAIQSDLMRSNWHCMIDVSRQIAARAIEIANEAARTISARSEMSSGLGFGVQPFDSVHTPTYSAGQCRELLDDARCRIRRQCVWVLDESQQPQSRRICYRHSIVTE